MPTSDKRESHSASRIVSNVSDSFRLRIPHPARRNASTGATSDKHARPRSQRRHAEDVGGERPEKSQREFRRPARARMQLYSAKYCQSTAPRAFGRRTVMVLGRYNTSMQIRTVMELNCQGPGPPYFVTNVRVNASTANMTSFVFKFTWPWNGR